MTTSSPNEVVVRHDYPDGLRLDVNLGKGVAAYPIFMMEKPGRMLAKYLETLIGKPSVERAALRFNEPPRVIILCDENTAELFGIDVETQFISAGWRVDALTVPAGEAAKSLAVVEQLCEALGTLGATRDTVLCSLGGGVVSDLTGFVAGIYKRGMHLVHISTTLLGLVDAAVGGKTAVNLPTGKNQIGLYKHPLVIATDLAYLQDLPEADYQCGLAEAAKTALLAGEDFTAWMEINAEGLRRRDPVTLKELIAACITFKAQVVAADPTEDMVPSTRLSLNYGHTLGHVIETITAQRHEEQLQQAQYVEESASTATPIVPIDAVPHGIAVAQGMRFEARIAMQLVDAPADFVLRQDALLDALGLPALDPSIMGSNRDAMLEVFYRDKKTQDSDLRFILLPAPGQPEIVTVSREVLCDHLRAWLAVPKRSEAQAAELAESDQASTSPDTESTPVTPDSTPVTPAPEPGSLHPEESTASAPKEPTT
ncbi:MAG: hypothetical protein FWE46_01360 [Coriobacteriia bacterium]|nr:hypothetical protein [Coriobacteriia bacterium]MCL2536690.1 hypothetical protein [Coriobacteriia bacterium]